MLKMDAKAQTLFAGTFERSMDAKKRVAVPGSWLAQKEGEEFYTVLHPSKQFLMVMPPEELLAWEQKFLENPSLNPAQKRAAVRTFYAGARKVSADTQGRILLSDDHCEAASLTGPLILAGGRSRFEIWDRDRFEAATAASEADYLKAAEEIGL